LQLQVSWLRCDTLNIISAGRYIYTSDQRFMASVLEDEERERQELLGLGDHGKEVVLPAEDEAVTSEAETWVLKVRGVALEDEGCYECQISTQPVRSQFYHLRVVGEFQGCQFGSI
jgi:hypothetical protein